LQGNSDGAMKARSWLINLAEPVLRPLRLFARNRVLAPLRRRGFENMPVVMVTGTCGKTSTCRLVASILKAAGHTAGLACSDGVYVDGQVTSKREHSGYGGAQRVLNHPAVTAAVLETARGGILKRGFYVDRCDVAAITNIGWEHIGIDGIETFEQMAAVKSQVTDMARKAVVLNADDPILSKMIDRYPPQKLILVSAHPDEPRVRGIVEKGGSCVVLDQEGFIVLEGARLIHVAEIPLTLGGAALHQAHNAMIATALAAGVNVGREAICAGLRNCKGGAEHNEARTSVVEGLSCHVQVERGDNPLALPVNIQTMRNLHPEGRRVAVTSSPGDRKNDHIEEVARLLAENFDDFICYDSEKFRRGRKPGEIPELTARYLVRHGANPSSIIKAQDLDDALAKLATVMEPGGAALVNSSVGGVEARVRKALSPRFGKAPPTTT
jgi:cyanophycin synthetase